MASSFDQWEKDPFFSAAEEVQESADRIWIHERNEASLMCDFDELRRDLHAALGTAKWQLEEFERAVESSYVGRSAENARTRHRQFIVAIESKIEVVENSLKELVLAEGKLSLPWVSLDDGERDELALFLSSSLARGDKVPATVPERDEEEGMQQGVHGKSVSDCSKNSPRSAEWSPKEAKVERLHGHRRTASASAESADIGLSLLSPSNVLFSGFLVILGLVAKLRWSKNVFRKWKGGDRHQLSQGINACYERNKSCLYGYDASYDKQLHGWIGAGHRQFQRSQYQIQYNRSIQLTFWVSLVLSLIGLRSICYIVPAIALP
ncbi:PREDICTED: uncharacterized protein LOC104607844 isoform X2 [Nelumbo nucifera]|uniref:Uncharacterized protein LOC104607844 isoform X2 n=1 Tax=Nelumbo nucifera TaxID=4432 RepID=A0A1U8B7H5_NELNU|nr:PREDICTED: uncharacterized protein LOC104607844 isoform X2 [Nelumbo nucifera]